MDTGFLSYFEKTIETNIFSDLFVSGLITTLVTIAFIFILRSVLIRMVRGRAEIMVKAQRRWINRINNTATILILIIPILIWAPQLHTFALSLTAFAVALVLTTKEILMCLTGGFLRATTHPFEIGDWITIDGCTGEVMRVDALTVMIEEIDVTTKTYQFTGRTIFIPNSKFLSHNVENNNFIKQYIYYDIPIVIKYFDFNFVMIMEQLELITEKYFLPYRDVATRFNRKVEKKVAVDFADAEPQFFLNTTDIGNIKFTVRLFVPTQQASYIAKNITRDFLSFVMNYKLQK